MDDQAKTGITALFSLFKLTGMLFGIWNSAQLFQQFMDNLFCNLLLIFVYIDDMLIANSDEATHHQHIFQQLAENSININAAKCVLAVRELDFLGHCILSAGIQLMGAKADAIQDCPQPTLQHQLHKFLSIIIFYHHFITTLCSDSYHCTNRSSLHARAPPHWSGLILHLTISSVL